VGIFNQYLMENESPGNYRKIITDCAQWFDEAGDDGYLLYRGGHLPKSVMVQHTVGDRKPLDSASWMHSAFNLYFERYHGHKWRSDHILFGTPEEEVAEQYSSGGGKVGIVLPIGTYKYLWSPAVHDLYKAAGMIGGQLYPEERTIRERLSKGVAADTDLSDFANIINRIFKDLDVEYKTNDILDNHRNEVMINCQSYYIISIRDDIAQQLGYR
jgi:hypothetical protein